MIECLLAYGYRADGSAARYFPQIQSNICRLNCLLRRVTLRCNLATHYPFQIQSQHVVF